MERNSQSLGRVDEITRFTNIDALQLNLVFRGYDTIEVLTDVIQNSLLGRVAVISSFGTDAAVLLHLVATIDSTTPVLFIDTGCHFDETLGYRRLLTDLLGLRDVRVLKPDPREEAARDPLRQRLTYDPDGCCDLRKVRPLDLAVGQFDATITGRKAFQSDTRAAIPRFELKSDRIVLNPLANWTTADLDGYFEAHRLPRHPLQAHGYASVGCAPCTTPIVPGEPVRAGRWRGQAKIECGIHGLEAGTASAAPQT